MQKRKKEIEGREKQTRFWLFKDPASLEWEQVRINKRNITLSNKTNANIPFKSIKNQYIIAGFIAPTNDNRLILFGIDWKTSKVKYF